MRAYKYNKYHVYPRNLCDHNNCMDAVWLKICKYIIVLYSPFSSIAFQPPQRCSEFSETFEGPDLIRSDNENRPQTETGSSKSSVIVGRDCRHRKIKLVCVMTSCRLAVNLRHSAARLLWVITGRDRALRRHQLRRDTACRFTWPIALLAPSIASEMSQMTTARVPASLLYACATGNLDVSTAQTRCKKSAANASEVTISWWEWDHRSVYIIIIIIIMVIHVDLQFLWRNFHSFQHLVQCKRDFIGSEEDLFASVGTVRRCV